MKCRRFLSLSFAHIGFGILQLSVFATQSVSDGLALCKHRLDIRFSDIVASMD